MNHLVARQDNLVLVAELKPSWLAEFDSDKWNKQPHDD